MINTLILRKDLGVIKSKDGARQVLQEAYRQNASILYKENGMLTRVDPEPSAGGFTFTNLRSTNPFQNLAITMDTEGSVEELFKHRKAFNAYWRGER